MLFVGETEWCGKKILENVGILRDQHPLKQEILEDIARLDSCCKFEVVMDKDNFPEIVFSYEKSAQLSDENYQHALKREIHLGKKLMTKRGGLSLHSVGSLNSINVLQSINSNSTEECEASPTPVMNLPSIDSVFTEVVSFVYMSFVP